MNSNKRKASDVFNLFADSNSKRFKLDDAINEMDSTVSNNGSPTITGHSNYRFINAVISEAYLGANKGKVLEQQEKHNIENDTSFIEQEYRGVNEILYKAQFG